MGVTCGVLLMLLVMMAAVDVGITLKEMVVETVFVIAIVIEVSSVVDGLSSSDIDSGVLMRPVELTIVTSPIPNVDKVKLSRVELIATVGKLIGLIKVDSSTKTDTVYTSEGVNKGVVDIRLSCNEADMLVIGTTVGIGVTVDSEELITTEGLPIRDALNIDRIVDSPISTVDKALLDGSTDTSEDKGTFIVKLSTNTTVTLIMPLPVDIVSLLEVVKTGEILKISALTVSVITA